MTRLSEYDFRLPKELIAQEPVACRSDARLMVVERQAEKIHHAHVRDIAHWIRPGDALVLNQTKVVPARILGRREKTGGRWQGLFLRADAFGNWQLLCKTRGRLADGEFIVLQDRDSRDSVRMKLLKKFEDGVWTARLETEETAWQLLDRIGRIPLPHYIRNGEMVESDINSYQTVYAKEKGSVAAPTAGLHFTEPLLRALEKQGVSVHRVTLHVGIGTFRPISNEDISHHQMHSETGRIDTTTASALNQCREEGGRIISVGTTSVRVLETCVSNGKLSAWEGDTNLFIRPGHSFGGIDGLMTNFHLPRSTLLVLVRSFGGSELMIRAYSEAVEEQYRFFSYGDAMLIL